MHDPAALPTTSRAAPVEGALGTLPDPALDVHLLYDQAPCCFQVLDTEGRYRMINRTGLSWLGCEQRDVLGVASPTDFYDTRGRSAFARNFQRLLEGHAVQGEELDLYGRDGARRRVVLSATPVRNAQGAVVATQAVIHDVTSLRRSAEAAAREAASALLARANAQVAALRRLRDGLLRQLSHEVRTPLHAILGFTELLQTGAVRPELPEFGEFLAHIHAGGRQLLSLAECALAEQLDRAKLVPCYAEPLDILREAHDTVDLLRPGAEARGVHVVVRGATDLPLFNTDRMHFRQALAGYLDNAIKHSPEGGRIDVRITQLGARLHVEVQDVGAGLERRRLEGLFAARAEPRRAPALGLGLDLVRELITAQGGRVCADSELGVGSVFRFELPSAAGS